MDETNHGLQVLIDEWKRDKAFLESVKAEIDGLDNISILQELSLVEKIHITLQSTKAKDIVDGVLDVLRAFIPKISSENALEVLVTVLRELLNRGETRNNGIQAFTALIFHLPRPTRAASSAYALLHTFLRRSMEALMGGVNQKNFPAIIEILRILLENFDHTIKIDPQNKYQKMRFYEKWLNTGIKLGTGQYSSVFLGYDLTTGRKRALKVMEWTSTIAHQTAKKTPRINREIKVVQQLKGKHIVDMYGIEYIYAPTSPHQTPDPDQEPTIQELVFCMEYCAKGDFAHYINSKKGKLLSEDEARYWLRQLAAGLKTLRDHKIVHRDLKPENLLLSTARDGSLTLKITDFTFARFVTPQELFESILGSPLYMAPEIFENQRYSDKADLWSVGVIMFKILTGRFPYVAKTVQLLARKVAGKRSHDWRTAPVSDGMKKFVGGLLQKKPNDRMDWDTFFNHTELKVKPRNQLEVISGIQVNQKDQILLRLKEEQQKLEQELLKRTREKDEVREDYVELQLKYKAIFEKTSNEEKKLQDELENLHNEHQTALQAIADLKSTFTKTRREQRETFKTVALESKATTREEYAKEAANWNALIFTLENRKATGKCDDCRYKS